jgi:hypothetical protein
MYRDMADTFTMVSKGDFDAVEGVFMNVNARRILCAEPCRGLRDVCALPAVLFAMASSTPAATFDPLH